MRPAQFTAPPLATPPDTASEAVRHWTMMLGVHGQQVTGTTDASVSVDSLLNTLSGGPDTRVIALAVVDDGDPTTAVALSSAETSDLGYPLIPSTGDAPAPDVYAWAVLSLPLRENVTVCGAEITLDVPFLPLPGEPLGDLGRAAVDAVVTEIENVCRSLGRTVIQIRQLGAPDTASADPSDPVLRARGFTPVLVEEQASVPVPADPSPCRIPAGFSTAIFPGMCPANATDRIIDGLCRLLEVFSADLPVGDLFSQPQSWDRERLERADRDARSTGRSIVWAMVLDGSGVPVAVSGFSRDPSDRPGVARQMLTVVDRRHRGTGLSRAVKTALAVAARDTGVNRIHTSVTATGATPVSVLNGEWGAELLARDVHWQKEGVGTGGTTRC
ncbi:GNAT family protein [Corynebacterium pygosceleis]|uniref:GNAT family protein n=1 Tax=Corynebacterium pygosceleis TaxID=2800406 RepID=UPI001906DC08|nr:GNAT family protein [Corynebacterium pygosceleis]MCL0120373.1 GNAT family N-acetyltransferase [Corynebacterium pygosceleis]